MFWSRLWLLLVTLAGGLLVLLGVIGARAARTELDHQAGLRLERAQHAASLLLRVNARKWMDTVAQLSTDAVLAESLEQASKGAADPQLVHKTVQERLRYFSETMRNVDLVLAVDAKGRAVARAGVDEAAYRDGVEGVPLIADALRGLRGDDTWSLEGRLYRVSASPVIARDRYVGALVVGQHVGPELAQSMKEVLGTDVAFLLRGRVLAASAPLAVLQDLPVLVDLQLGEMARRGRSQQLAAAAGEQRFLVVLAPFAGEAADHKAAYAVMAPRPPLGWSSLLSVAEWRGLPPLALAAIVLGVALLALLGAALVRFEWTRPVERLARAAQALARGDLDRLDDDTPGKLGAIARAVNITLDRLGAHPSAAAPSAHAAGRTPEPEAPPARSWTVPLTPIATAAPIATTASTASAASRASQRAPTRPELPAVRLGSHRAPIGPLIPEDPIGRDLFGNELVADKFNAEEPAPRDLEHRHEADPVIPLTRSSREPADGPDFIDAPGLEFGSLPKAVSAAVAAPVDLDDQFHRVFDEFIETKQRLGESTTGVTYERLALKLQSNLEQLRERYGCKVVKFEVYVKDGRAALKATPVPSSEP